MYVYECMQRRKNPNPRLICPRDLGSFLSVSISHTFRPLFALLFQQKKCYLCTFELEHSHLCEPETHSANEDKDGISGRKIMEKDGSSNLWMKGFTPDEKKTRKVEVTVRETPVFFCSKALFTRQKKGELWVKNGACEREKELAKGLLTSRPSSYMVMNKTSTTSSTSL